MLHHPVYRSEFTMYSAVSQEQWHCAPHAHECFELLYVLEGRCQIKTPTGDYISEPNDLIVFRPYQWHEETQLTRTYAVVCLRFPREFLAEYRIPLPEPSLLPTVVTLPRGDAFRAILERIVAEYEQRDAYSEAMIAAYMLQFAVLLRRALKQSDPGEPATVPMQATDLRRLLDQHVSSAASIRELAKQVHMSESHFSHQVKQLLGVAPKTYVREQRIARARELLHSTALSVEEIAALLGYDAPTSFFRAFKRVTGTTPGEFRHRRS
ncbi:MAG TPA: helix-turn-helix domain-containing protein [Roseiflexaceae bacterium]|nr:helix-turn-helix domain-containing protein [Roseiflexaceae bacterium]